MGVAAVPKYLGEEFPDAAPGHRFALYLPYWQSRSWDREKDRPAREGDRATGKKPTFDVVKKLPKHSTELMKSLLVRQRAAAQCFESAQSLLRVEAQSTAPFATGLGYEHPLENGFAFLAPYGLPYLPGSSVKGVLRTAASELARGIFGHRAGWEKKHIDLLFGCADADGESHRRGALSFWDVIPQITEAEASLRVEVMTPHQSDYYQSKSSPHDCGSPTPIFFLTVPPGSAFEFHVRCDRRYLGSAPDGLSGDGWKTLLDAAFRHAFDWLGFGAKTAVGYGAMQEDPKAKQQRRQQEAAVRAETDRKEAEARRAKMSPEELAWEEHEPIISTFRQQFSVARSKPYQPGSLFDNQRNELLKAALSWTDTKSRHAAAALVGETMKKEWGMPSAKERKQRLKDTIEKLLDAS